MLKNCFNTRLKRKYLKQERKKKKKCLSLSSSCIPFIISILFFSSNNCNIDRTEPNCFSIQIFFVKKKCDISIEKNKDLSDDPFCKPHINLIVRKRFETSMVYP